MGENFNRWWGQFRQQSTGRQVAAWVGVAFVSLFLLGVVSGPEEAEPTRSSSPIAAPAGEPTSPTVAEIAKLRADSVAKRRQAAKKAAAKRARAKARRAKARRVAIVKRKIRAKRAAKRRAAARARRQQAEEEAASQCDPNYEGACLDPNASDYDCQGGSGDGPMYTGPVQSVGSDPYDLDADGDGYACE